MTPSATQEVTHKTAQDATRNMDDTMTQTQTMRQTDSRDVEAHLFNGAIAQRVTDLLNALDVPAALDHYEPGMFQVRLDPTDRTQPHGWIAVAGTDTDGEPGWLVLKTSRDDDFDFYDTAEDIAPIRLYLPVTAEPAQVAIALMAFLAKKAGR